MESDYREVIELVAEMRGDDLRRFGAWLRENKDAAEHPWDNTEVEPLECPDCGEPLDEILHARSRRLKEEKGKWIETDVFSDEHSCAKCNYTLDAEDTDALGLNK